MNKTWPCLHRNRGSLWERYGESHAGKVGKNIDKNTPYLDKVWTLSYRSFTEAVGSHGRYSLWRGMCNYVNCFRCGAKIFSIMPVYIQVDVAAFKIAASWCCPFDP